MNIDLIQSTRSALSKLGVDKRSTLLLGLSGGIDSMTLGFVLKQLQSEGFFDRLIFCHVDHKLRAAESDLDAEFVRSIANDWDVPVEIVELGIGVAADITTTASEANARNARYKVFERIADQLKIETVVTAHNANDQAETVVMRLMRGAGPRGLAGIPAERKLNSSLRVIRPWLQIPREEIAAFAGSNNIAYREDSTNVSNVYLRNRVRNELLPVMQATSGTMLVESLGCMAEMMRHQSRYFDAEAEMLFFQDGREELDLDLFLQSPRPIKFAAIELLLKRHHSLEMLSTRTFERILDWVGRSEQEKRAPSVFDLRSGVRLRIANERIGIEREEAFDLLESRLLIENEPCQTSAGELKLSLQDVADVDRSQNIAAFDLETMSSEWLLVRSWRAGDRMNPFGMEGRKLISDLLLESGIKSSSRKRAYPVVAHPDTGEILWLPGIRRSNAYPIIDSTRRIVVCELVSTKER